MLPSSRCPRTPPHASPPPSPTRRPHPSYRIFMPQSPRWEASRRQSLPVMLFGSNNICSCSKSSGGSLGWGRWGSQRGGSEKPSPFHTHTEWCTRPAGARDGRGEPQTPPCRQQPKQPHLTCCMGVVERPGVVLPRILPLMPGI